MTTLRSTWGRIVAVALGLLGAITILEIALRVLVPSPASEMLRGLHRVAPGKPWLYELVPGARQRDPRVPGVVYAVNDAGFRDVPFPSSRRDGVYRIAVIGDSLAFGYGVTLEETFAKRLESRLHEGADTPRYEVLNFGVSGYNTYTEAALLEGVVLAYEPDLVLVQFCINDLNDPTLHFDASTMHALGDLPDAAYPDPAAAHARVNALPGPAERLCRVSRVCSGIADALAPAVTPEMTATLAPHEHPGAVELSWLAALDARMATLTREHGGRLAVVVFPYESQLASGAPQALQDELKALGERAGIDVIDLLPAFRRAAESSAVPLFHDLWHPTARGHEVAADAIFRALADADLLPGESARGSKHPLQEK